MGYRNKDITTPVLSRATKKAIVECDQPKIDLRRAAKGLRHQSPRHGVLSLLC